MAFTTPALALLAVSRAPASERGAALGTFSAFIDLAFGLGPIAMGAVAASTTTPIAFLSAAGVALAGALILWRWLKDAEPDAEPDQVDGSPSERNASTSSS